LAGGLGVAMGAAATADDSVADALTADAVPTPRAIPDAMSAAESVNAPATRDLLVTMCSFCKI
jgi:hypothetical protein